MVREDIGCLKYRLLIITHCHDADYLQQFANTVHTRFEIMDYRNLQNKIIQHTNENGVIKTVFWVIKKSIEKTIIQFKYGYVIEKSLTGNFPFIHSKMNATFKIADFKDMEYFQNDLKPWKEWSKRFKRRFDKGQTCIACFTEEKALGYIWISTVPESDPDLGLEIRPDADEVYGFDLFVLPEYRKFLIGFELISRWLEYSKKAGKKKAIGVVLSANTPMLMTVKLGFGFKIVRTVQSLKFFNWIGILISSKESG
jgi:GNAT superfamily N-acetyltransferase